MAGVVQKYLLEILGKKQFPEVTPGDLKVGWGCAACAEHLDPVVSGGRPGQKMFKINVLPAVRLRFEPKLKGLRWLGVTWKLNVAGESVKFQAFPDGNPCCVVHNTVKTKMMTYGSHEENEDDVYERRYVVVQVKEEVSYVSTYTSL